MSTSTACLRSMSHAAVGGFLLLTFLTIAPNRVHAQAIDFESLNAPGNGTGGLILKNQLAGNGILFQGVTVLDYSQGIAIPNFTHSGTKAIELCYGVEFCTGPLDFSFTTPQRHVKLWVGYSYSLEAPQAVVMRAYDGFGNELGSDMKTLGPSTGVIPISTSLEVSLPVLARIVRVTVGFLGAESMPASMFNNSLAVDDIQFDIQGPPPTCPATQPPGLGLIAPIDGQVLVQNALTVEANLSTPDPFATMQVSATGSTALTNTFGPVFAGSGHVTYANITGLLFPGSNAVTITAKDCAGITERRLTVFYRNDVTATPILVIDENNMPVPGAEVYANGTYLGRTNTAGQLSAMPPLSDGTRIVARKFVDESSTYRGNHSKGSFQNWKFRVYISNVAVENDGTLTAYNVKLEPNPLALQVVKVLKRNPLIGLHVVASIEWDASTAEMEAVKQKLIGASRFLYNATDGQILLEQAEVVDEGTYWEDADYRVYANQSLRENVDCPRGAFFEDSFWCNGSWIHVQINSDPPTYAHEFGHYGFDVGDEYSDDDASVQCTFRLSVGSIPPGANPFQGGFPAASCMMFNQWSAPKLCSSRAENPHVHGTRQGDSSCWSTLIDHYKDWNDNARWTLQSPDSRGFIPGLINGASPPLVAWTPRITFENHSHPNLCAPLTFMDTASNGGPATGQEIWLHTTYGADILEGKTDENGQLTGTGLHVGDHVENLTIQSSDCSAVAMLRPGEPLNDRPRLVGVSQKQAAPPVSREERLGPRQLVAQQPVFRVFATLTPGKAEKSAELLVWAESFAGKRLALLKAPQVNVKSVGHTEGPKTVLRYSPQKKGYVAILTGLPLDFEAGIEIVVTDPEGHTERRMARFTINRTDPRKVTDIFSADGQLLLSVPAKGLPAGSRISVGPAVVQSPVLVSDEGVVSGPFRIASDTTNKFSIPARLSFRLAHGRRRPGTAAYDVKSFRILWYDAVTAKWVQRESTLLPFPVDIVSVKTEYLGTFVLVARKESVKPNQKD